MDSVDVIVRPILSQDLPHCWKPQRNPGSAEDITKNSKYLEHLTYHGGLNTAVWTRREPEKIRQMWEESVFRETAKELEKVDGLLEVWKADSSCSQEIVASTVGLVEAWLENLQIETVSKEDVCEEIVETVPSSANVSTKTAVEKDFEKEDVQLSEESLLHLPDRPNGWILLLLFLSLVILQRVFLLPTEIGQCNRQ